MQPLFLIIGPPAVGKSTTSRALAATFRKSIHIPADDIRHFVVSGLVQPSVEEWSEELVEQIRVSRESAIQMALIYHNAGFAVVIEDFLEPNQLVEYQPLLEHPQIHKVVVFPSEETAHARNAKRAKSSRERDFFDKAISLAYQNLSVFVERFRQDGWMVLDTTDLSVDAAVSEIRKSVQ